MIRESPEVLYLRKANKILRFAQNDKREACKILRFAQNDKWEACKILRFAQNDKWEVFVSISSQNKSTENNQEQQYAGKDKYS